MPNRAKEVDRIEILIRSLLKLPDNRRCINCHSLGPQYVCTNFWTFVCTSCSGIHREFTHRVKSISMAKFTSEELCSLQAGGNQRAREIYFKDWDPHLHSIPDSCNLPKLRDFIRHVYVDRKYCGGTQSKSTNMLSSIKAGNMEVIFENKKMGGVHYNGSRSLRYDGKSSHGGRNDNKSFRYYYDEKKSPQYSKENSRYGGISRSPVHFEVVDDRVRDNGFASGRWSRSTISPNQESKGISKSTDPIKSTDPLAVKGVYENDGENNDSPVSAKIEIACSNGLAEAEHENITSQSLIDFNTDPLPPTETTPPSSNGGDCWASFESSKNKASQVSNTNTLECLLLELSVPISVEDPPPPELAVGDMESLPVENQPSTPKTKSLGVPPNECGAESLLVSGHGDSFAEVIDDGELIPDKSTSCQRIAPAVEMLDNQPWVSSIALNTGHVSSGFDSQPPPVEANSSSRKELPMDLFTASYSSVLAQRCWQTLPSQPMGFGMQYYPTMMPVSSLPDSSKSTNPFDLNDETTGAQNQHFGSLSLLQAPHSNVPTSALMRPPPHNYAHNKSAQMGQQVFTNMHARVGGFGNMESSDEVEGRSKAPNTSTSPMLGNPFG